MSTTATTTTNTANTANTANNLHFHNIELILLDIEGTTTPISFVKDILFPYSSSYLQQYLQHHYQLQDDEFKQDVRTLIQCAIEDNQIKPQSATEIPTTPIAVHAQDDLSISHPDYEQLKEKQIAALIKNVNEQIYVDRKGGALKQLQGHMWRDGFQNGELKGVMFPDTYTNIEKWHTNGTRIYIYSSGSVEAQKNIFGYTEQGSLLPYISGHFDTAVGAKVDKTSYDNIFKQLSIDPARVLFCTDIYKEAKACKEAGGNTVIMVRPGNAPLPADNEFPTAKSFDEITL